jgi:hypothetical protein
VRIRPLILLLILLVACTKKASSPPPQVLSHDFRVAARKLMRAIDEIPTSQLDRDSFVKSATADKLYDANGKTFSAVEKLAREANDQRENGADNAAYELLENYYTAAFIVSSDRVHQAFKGKHDPRCPDDSCSGIYAICQKEALQALENGEHIPAPRCKVDANGHLPGIVVSR